MSLLQTLWRVDKAQNAEKMAPHAVLHFLCAVGVFQKGLTALVETQRTVMAAVGDKASLNCQLMQPKDVLQVTWQKVLPEGETNVATCNKYFGQKVNQHFGDKVEFISAGLQNSSIVIRNVTEQDEGCYRCLFNTYPEGALIATTCLQLYELHEPVLHVRESNGAEEMVVSCRATGRPAPAVTLTVPHYNSTSVTNTNSTVTVTVTAVLSRLRDNSTQVGCAARVLSGPRIEVFVMIPELKQPDDFTLVIVIAPCLCVAVAAAAAAAVYIIVLLIRKHQRRLEDSEKIETPQKAIKDFNETKTPFMENENELRLRTSTENQKASPAGC